MHTTRGENIPPKWQPKQTSLFRRDFRQLCYLIANISGKQQDIVNQKMALPIAVIPVHVYLIW